MVFVASVHPFVVHLPSLVPANPGSVVLANSSRSSTSSSSREFSCPSFQRNVEVCRCQAQRLPACCATSTKREATSGRYMARWRRFSSQECLTRAYNILGLETRGGEPWSKLEFQGRLEGERRSAKESRITAAELAGEGHVYLSPPLESEQFSCQDTKA